MERSEMRSFELMLVLGTVTATTFVQSPAFAAGDPASGEKLAKEYCARCHDVAPGGAFKKYPPSFASIAIYRSPEQIYARIVFPSMHSGMPDVGFYLLQPKNITDLVAYITSLEKSP
jgi:mono/diheme cytochrome c family protein